MTTTDQPLVPSQVTATFSRDSLEFLYELVLRQQVVLGAPDARVLIDRAFVALDELGAALVASVPKEAPIP